MWLGNQKAERNTAAHGVSITALVFQPDFQKGGEDTRPDSGLLALGGSGGGWRDHLSESELLAASTISCLSSASANKDAATL